MWRSKFQEGGRSRNPKAGGRVQKGVTHWLQEEVKEREAQHLNDAVTLCASREAGMHPREEKEAMHEDFLWVKHKGVDPWRWSMGRRIA